MLVEVMTCTTRQEEYYVFIDGRKATVTLGWTSNREPCGYQNNVDARGEFGMGRKRRKKERKDKREVGRKRRLLRPARESARVPGPRAYEGSDWLDSFFH
jgi:hypothetical protein